MKFLFDASSMLRMIKSVEEEKALRLLSENCILDLTKYEVGNALWKQHILHHALSEKEFQELVQLLREIVLHTNILTADAESLAEVARMATRERITFYDASYISIAKGKNLTLVTEDVRLRKVSSKHARTISCKETTTS